MCIGTAVIGFSTAIVGAGTCGLPGSFTLLSLLVPPTGSTQQVGPRFPSSQH